MMYESSLVKRVGKDYEVVADTGAGLDTPGAPDADREPTQNGAQWGFPRVDLFSYFRD